MKKTITAFLLIISFSCIAQKKDTVRVVMLVSDTSLYMPMSRPMYGYEVLNPEYLSYIDPGFYHYSYNMVHEKYLNDKKQPLKKSIIVWSSKQL